MDVFRPRPIKLKSLDQTVRLHATGDWHVGESGCAEERLRRSILSIADDPSSVVFLMGDLGGFITPMDRRWDPESVAEGLSIHDLSDWGGVLSRRIVDISAPVRGRILGSLLGNHEEVYNKRNSCQVHKDIAAGLGCRPLAYSALFTLRLIAPEGNRQIRVMATHGSGASATPGGKLNRLIRTMQSFDADLILMGHVHACISHRLSQIRQIGENIGEINQLGVITGTYLRTYCNGHSGYGERAGYSPTSLGHPCIEIHPRSLAMSVMWV